MQNRLAGVSLMGLIIVLVLLGVVALFGMKVIPSYMEFRTAKNTINALAREKPNAPPPEIRRAFEARANVDGIESLRADQLEINKGTISFAYRKEVQLFTGVGLYIDYAASTQ